MPESSIYQENAEFDEWYDGLGLTVLVMCKTIANLPAPNSSSINSCILVETIGIKSTVLAAASA